MHAIPEMAPTEPGLLYVDGNSLGRPSQATLDRLRQVAEIEWGQRLVRSWGEAGWWELPVTVGDKIAQLVGALPGEVVAADSTSVNLYKLAHAVMSQTPRRRIVSDRGNFPSDLYILQGIVAQFPGAELVLVDSEDPAEIESSLGSDVALLSLSHVAFRSGRLQPMARLSEAAHRAGALTLWDLSHSVGAVDVQLERSGADLAVGCSYKYLNGGPGAVAFLYVRREHQADLRSPIWGWHGQENPFEFGIEYKPREGVARFLAGSPPVLPLTALDAALDLHLEVGAAELRARSQAITTRFLDHYEQRLAALGFGLLTPRAADHRGSHVMLTHPAAWQINQALIREHAMIPDFRAPDGLRVGFAPLYNTLEDADEAAFRIERAVIARDFEKYTAERTLIT